MYRYCHWVLRLPVRPILHHFFYRQKHSWIFAENEMLSISKSSIGIDPLTICSQLIRPSHDKTQSPKVRLTNVLFLHTLWLLAPSYWDYLAIRRFALTWGTKKSRTICLWYSPVTITLARSSKSKTSPHRSWKKFHSFISLDWYHSLQSIWSKYNEHKCRTCVYSEGLFDSCASMIFYTLPLPTRIFIMMSTFSR